MFSHIFIGTTDFERALTFYSAVLSALGLKLRFTDPARPWAAWQPADSERPLLIIGSPYNKQPHHPGNGQMVALSAAGRDMVDRAYQRALNAGGISEGAPGLRPEYHPDYYGAYVRDPDGNKLCIVCHEATA